MAHVELPPSEFAPLDPGIVVGSYVIIRTLSVAPERHTYLVQLTPEPDASPMAVEPVFRLIETPMGLLTDAMTVAALQLRHQRLLALRESFVVGEREYVIADLASQDWPEPPPPPLVIEEALAVGVMIGEVLAFLHGRGVAHQHVIPAHIVIASQGIFLTGMEEAVLVQSAGHEADALFARDANQLAQAVGQLATSEANPSPSALALQRIVRRGTEGAYNTVREIMLDFLQALPDGLPKLSPAAATAPLRVFTGKATSVGLVRTQNQDSAAVLLLDVDDDQPHATPGGIFLVADGMGGEAHGEVASRIAVRMITSEVARRFLSPMARASASDLTGEQDQLGDAPTTMNLDSIAALIEAFRAANARIRNMARRLERAAGTTATAIMLFGHDAILGHIGDSRAYLYRDGEMVQLTQDHSLLQRLIELGQYDPNMPATQVPRNYLYRSLGQADEVDIDTRIMKIGVGDVIMICSDGLWDLVPNDTIKDILGSSLDPDAAAQRLVDQANEAGGNDNSTALVIHFVARN